MTTTVALEALKDAHRRTWASGDYPLIATLVTEVGERIVDIAGVTDGDYVLDVAAGSGNAAIPAACRGGLVIASDLTPELFVAGRRRAAAAEVDVEWIAADAEELPFEDDRFDHVLSSLGVQFAPRHEVVASELVRVCRPGGKITLGNWAADSYIGKFFSTIGPYMPKPPAYASPPPKWGDAEHVEQLFAPHPVDVTIERHSLDFEAGTAATFIDHFGEHYGPLLQARNTLGERWTALRDDLIAMSEESDAGRNGGWRAPSDYLVIVARKHD